MSKMNEMDVIVELSHEFGGPAYVKGGGGNTSVKNESTLWVKPSGDHTFRIDPGKVRGDEPSQNRRSVRGAYA